MVTFESQYGRLEPFDDGHVPETFRFHNESSNDGVNIPRIVRYNDSSSSSRSDVHIYDEVLNQHHARMLYDVTATYEPSLNRLHYKDENFISASVTCSNSGKLSKPEEVKLKGESPWGTYVTISEALDWSNWKKAVATNRTESIGKNACTDYIDYDGYQIQWRQDVVDFLTWRKKKRKSSSTLDESDEQPNYISDLNSIRHSLAVEAVAQFFLETIPIKPGTTMVASISKSPSPQPSLFGLDNFLKHVHGVAVWALSSRPGQSVQYHIDYAELLRYEYNVTVPPLWAATLQCSNLWNDQALAQRNAYLSCALCYKMYSSSKLHNVSQQQSMAPRAISEQTNQVCLHCYCHNSVIRGGEFCVNLRGLEHYFVHGYKGKKSGDIMGGWSRPIDPNLTQNGGVSVDKVTDWVTIPYACNRGIVHRGDLPHLSAPIESIGCDVADINISHQNESPFLSRVIVGFNAFSHDVGNIVAKAPEHSKAFRRKVKLYRTTMGASSFEKLSQENASPCDNSNSISKEGMNISQIRRHKGLTKLLVLAKREKVKKDLRRTQDQLSIRIWYRLLEHHRHRANSGSLAVSQNQSLLRVLDLVDELGIQNGDSNRENTWPTSNDVHVHLHHMLLTEVSYRFHDTQGTAGIPGARYGLKSVSFADEKKWPNDERGKSCLISLQTCLDIFQIM